MARAKDVQVCWKTHIDIRFMVQLDYDTSSLLPTGLLGCGAGSVDLFLPAEALGAGYAETEGRHNRYRVAEGHRYALGEPCFLQQYWPSLF